MKQNYDLDKINVIVVDDHSLVRKSIMGVLERYDNINVVADFSGGVELLEKIEKIKVDVILLDINMPEMDGVETMKRLYKLNPELKVIALTMHDDMKTIREMMESGAKGYILKDSPFTDLIKALQQVNSGKIYYTTKVANIMLESYTNLMQKRNIDPDDVISAREKEIIALVAKGFTNKEIGDKLYLSARTVENHRQNIKRKLKIETTAELVKYAYSKGLVEQK